MFGIKRNLNESWRDAAKRYAARYGLEAEVLEMFDAAVKGGQAEGDAALDACYEWDVLELFEDGSFEFKMKPEEEPK